MGSADTGVHIRFPMQNVSEMNAEIALHKENVIYY